MQYLDFCGEAARHVPVKVNVSFSILADVRQFLAMAAFASCQRTSIVKSFVSFAIRATAKLLASSDIDL